MPIVAVNFSKIEAKNNNIKADNINVSNTPSITNITKFDKLFDMKNVVSIEYTYSTSYDPDVGSIAIEGDVLYSSEKADKLVEDWKKNKKVDDDMAVEVLNAIFRRCLSKAIEISADIRLPPPMRFPNVIKDDKKESNK